MTKSKLKAIKPEKKEKRLKMFVYGVSGIGKTTATLQFPNAYIIDTERGTEHYAEMINKSGSVVFSSVDYNEVKQEIETLLVEQHDYKTLIIDPVTLLYHSIQDLWTKRFEGEARLKSKNTNADMQDFGMRYWGKVKSDYKALQRLILKLDMNVIITAHQKDVYGSGFSKVGVTFDSMKGDDYFFDYVFRLEKRGKERVAVTVKERSEIGKNKFPTEFPWSYKNFLKFYGDIIEKKSTPTKMASLEQVEEITNLIGVVKISEEEISKWFRKADIATWQEMTSDQIDKCIDYCRKILDTIKNKEVK